MRFQKNILLVFTLLFLSISCEDKENDALLPKALFSFEKLRNNQITFTNNSINANTFNWNFGDGNTSSEQHPTHIFSESGKFTVSLNVSNEQGRDVYNFDIEIESFTTVLTIAGNGTSGYRDGNQDQVLFDLPYDLEIDALDNIYIADFSNARVRKINPAGVVSTISGGENGFEDTDGINAFSSPHSIAISNEQNIYVTGAFNDRIYEVTFSGVLSFLAGNTFGFEDGTGVEAQFDYPTGLDVDSDGNIYVADRKNHSIRKVTPSGIVTTVAGGSQGFEDGIGILAKFFSPTDVAVDNTGNVYVADYFNHCIRKISVDGEVTTLAGSTQGYKDGPANEAQFDFPHGVAVDNMGIVYVADQENHRIRRISKDGQVSTLTGSIRGFKDGIGEDAMFNEPLNLAIDNKGNIYVVDSKNHSVRKIILN